MINLNLFNLKKGEIIVLKLFKTIASTGLILLGLSTAAMAATPKDVLVVAQIAEPKSMDPATVTAVNDFRILMNVYDGLVRYKDGTLEIEPSLAKSWDISDDGKVYTFQLRKGVKFHDGTDFNAEAVKFNFDRMLVKDHPQAGTGPFPLSFFFSAIKETTVKGSHTVSFRMDDPYAPLLSNLAYPTGLIISPSAVKKHGKDVGRNPAGTGAFKFREWKSNQHVIIDRNDS